MSEERLHSQLLTPSAPYVFTTRAPDGHEPPAAVNDMFHDIHRMQSADMSQLEHPTAASAQRHPPTTVAPSTRTSVPASPHSGGLRIENLTDTVTNNFSSMHATGRSGTTTPTALTPPCSAPQQTFIPGENHHSIRPTSSGFLSSSPVSLDTPQQSRPGVSSVAAPRSRSARPATARRPPSSQRTPSASPARTDSPARQPTAPCLQTYL